MAVKILQAKGCFADLVDRMWTYMEEGDIDRAQCAREKALGMYALIETAKRWSPTITDGYYSELFIDLQSATVPEPYINGNVRLNGIIITPQFTSYDGIDGFVDKAIISTNCNISQNDDLIQVSSVEIGRLGILQSIKTTFESLSQSRDGSSGGGTGTEIVTEIESGDFSDSQPRCLTNAQILSVIEKINELCECDC